MKPASTQRSQRRRDLYKFVPPKNIRSKSPTKTHCRCTSWNSYEPFTFFRSIWICLDPTILLGFRMIPIQTTRYGLSEAPSLDLWPARLLAMKSSSAALACVKWSNFLPVLMADYNCHHTIWWLWLENIHTPEHAIGSTSGKTDGFCSFFLLFLVLFELVDGFGFFGEVFHLRFFVGGVLEGAPKWRTPGLVRFAF